MSTDRIAQLKAFLEQDPEDAFTHYALALELWKAGRRDEARKTFEALLARNPDYVGAYYHLARLYQELGLPEEAARTYQRGITTARAQGAEHALRELMEAWERFQEEQSP
ncbi:MAG: tetratricopeptide repeat protein [Bacteroidetes bacterium]|nr:tetratricopeptide repeat protein [Rhodothermia bacterium]MCS7155747.1 tetratricopeptide repeat protein [Bacteroidota bacterium]MCX7906152.1 tetratricopeptide repeat protein [Bacteroidota bacterium]MDW8138280.1 tetratricopeptide repeat protein [Bacteroidota bacterium]MDW8285964.1 tetratricopeptide repeat protein [Bacteroidota bacterium]